MADLLDVERDLARLERRRADLADQIMRERAGEWLDRQEARIMLRRVVMAVLVVLGAVTVAEAQSADRWRLEITGAASSTYDFTSVQCNQAPAPVPPGVPLNPHLIIWDDPANAGRVCVHDTGVGSGPLFALPIGSYSATLRAGNAAGYTGPSNAADFSRLTPPSAAPSGFRFGRTGS